MFVFGSDQNQRAYFRDHATVPGANAIKIIYRPLPSAKVWAPYILVVNLHVFFTGGYQDIALRCSNFLSSLARQNRKTSAFDLLVHSV